MKHEVSGGFDYENNDLPIHLVKELEIIEEMMNTVSSELMKNEFEAFYIVSDHGASRLAVLRKKEEKYETETSGEHAGRCCPVFPSYDLPFAAEENGYLVLADYGRFRGSRAGKVEVHGGASLEEVVVPIITLRRKKSKIIVKSTGDMPVSDFMKGTELTLFFSEAVSSVRVLWNGKVYTSQGRGEQHHTLVLAEMKHIGTYPIEVYVGDDLLDTLSLQTKGKTGNMNQSFDDFF